MTHEEVPVIQTSEKELTIHITLDGLRRAIEGRTDENYKVIKPEKLLDAFKSKLQDYAESNASELGITEFQYLLDRITDEIYTDATDIIDVVSDEHS